MNNSEKRRQLFERQQRLNTLLKVDVPIFMDIARNSGPDIADRVLLTLNEYATLIEQNLQELDRQERR